MSHTFIFVGTRDVIMRKYLRRILWSRNSCDIEKVVFICLANRYPEITQPLHLVVILPLDFLEKEAEGCSLISTYYRELRLLLFE